MIYPKAFTKYAMNIPEVIDIMKDLGFENIANPGMLEYHRKVYDHPKGRDENIPMENIKEAFAARGYELSCHSLS